MGMSDISLLLLMLLGTNLMLMYIGRGIWELVEKKK